jgi:very-short-patch-repair endonuclease
VDVTAIGRRLPRHRDGLRCHETRVLDGRDLRWVGPIPTTSAARTALDLAGTDGPRTAERVLAQALRSRLTTEAEVRSLITRARGHHGVGIVARLIDTGPAFDRSEAERLLLELIRRSGLPEPRTNVRVGGYEVDALWDDLDVVVEFDSLTFHGDVLAFRRDRRKSRRLQAAGYDVVPVVWSDLQDAPELVVADISAVLAVARVRNR